MFIEAGTWLPIDNGMKTIVIIEDGSGELYIRKGIGENNEKYFVRDLSEGNVVLPAPSNLNISVVIYAVERLQYKVITHEEFLEYPVAKIEKTLYKLMKAEGSGTQPKRCNTILLGCEVEAEQGDSFLAPYGEIFFLEFSDEAELTVKEKMLLPERVGVVSSSRAITFAVAGKYRAYRFADFVEKYSIELIWRIVLDEIYMYMSFVEKYFSDREIFFEKRYDSLEKDKDQFEKNFSRCILGWVINEDLPTVERSDAPIITALRQIAAKLGMDKSQITIPSGINKDSSNDEILKALLSSNNLYGRQIKLEDKWWTMDIGPILVFRNDIPYAVIPVTPQKYVLIDYENGRKLNVDENLAAEIAANAYVFFRKIPGKLNTLTDWLGWACKLCWGYDYFIIVIACLLIGLLPLVVPLVTNTVFEDIIPSYDAQAHIIVVQLMMVALCAQAFTTLIRDVAVLRVKNNIRMSIEPALWIKLLDLPASFFRKYNVGDLSNRMAGIGVISSQFSNIVSTGLFNGLFGIFNLAVMAYYSIKLTCITCVVWVIYLIFAAFFIVRLKKFQEKHLNASGIVSGILVQILSGLNVFKMQNAEERAMELWTEKFGESWKYNRKQRWQGNYLSILNQIQPLILNGLIFYFSMYFMDEAVKGGAALLTTANFLSFFAAMGSFSGAISGMVGGMMGMMSLLPVFERLQPVIEEETESSDDKPSAPVLKGEVFLNRVSFRYQPDLPIVLYDINLKIDKGSFVAIVGNSGCGKSTLLRLILGMESPTAGLVEFDGQDISQLDIGSLRRQLGVVMQRGRLMAGTILNNIIGALPLTIDDAWEAAECVGLADDIRAMPMGMHTYISEDGSNISGGQKQRILIARAIVNHARIIVFDEATSSLDNETQRMVAETIERLQATRIVVAHRLSTVRNADKIVVLDKGRIVEIGNYDELMALNGYFAKLANRQIL